ncbi:MAG: glycosyltransferase family 39 protein [Deltaproteobacteria bacterium]|nr:glycosyltransferase family 39 protein [Deltaproteobacteria bacterium]MBW2341309.1 glycosyltransferase family 39 protein [Deltaproteobacteria bacterium]
MKRLAILVIALGFAIRLFCFQYTYIISPDGVLYIHQARAIYYGLSDSLISVSRNFLSNYPIFIAGAYTIFRDWVIAAKVVSLFFGTLTLIPLYFLLRRFFDDKISILATLIFALTPVFIDRSADAVRAPVFWFFSVLGLYLFVSQLDKRNRLYLLLSSLSFLMATWARAEAILFIIVSCLYMLLVKQERKLEKLVIFIMPAAITMSIAIFGAIGNMSDLNIFRYKQMLSYGSSAIERYEIVRGSLREFTDQSPDSPLKRFLLLARHLAWWVALGALLASMVETFFHPFFIVFIVGFKGILKKIKEDQRILYLSILTVCVFFFLYLVILIIWEMYTRYMGIFVFPSFIFVGFGLEKIISFLRSRFNLKESIALAVVCLLILACGLPKSLKPSQTDKRVFVEIAESIADREGNDEEILVVTSRESIRWISFYANVNYEGAPFPEKNYDLDNILGSSYEEFVRNLRKRGISYFLWEEKHWPKESASYIERQNPGDFVKIGTWSHPDTGKLILFKVI